MQAKVLIACAALAAAPAFAGTEDVQFPRDYLKGVLYQNLDRHDIKQYRELYTQHNVVEAVRKGKPVPSGAVITLVQWSVQTDEKGEPLKDGNGRFIKKDIVGHTIMEKRKGWGADYPASKRNGEWEYAAFDSKGDRNPKANIDACFQCHLPHAKQDFVISLAKLNNTFPSEQAAAKKVPGGDVRIAGFAFMPGKIAAAAGKALTFFNGDDTPHQISVVNGPRTAVFLKGEKATLTLDKAGEYGYICGLHPSMKGTIEVR